MFEDFEFNPMAAAAGLLGGILSMVVMSQSPVGLIWKIGGFLGTAVVCYFI
jgi:hypothetical protein